MRLSKLLVPVLALAMLLAGQAPARADQTSDDLAKAKEQQELLDQVRAKLSGNLADALAAQSELERSLEANVKQQQKLADQIDEAHRKVVSLNQAIAGLDHDIAVLEGRIAVERAELNSLARAIYAQPDSVLLMATEAHDLGDLMTRVSDLHSASARAQALKKRLDDDLSRVQAERAQRQKDLDVQVQLQDGLTANLAALQALQLDQEKSKKDLAAKIADTQQELDSAAKQSAELAKRIAELLQEQQNEIIAAAMQQVWDQVKVLESDPGRVGGVKSSDGHSKKYRFMWPEPYATISQGYGPSDLGFEPSFKGFAHFHTGIDLVLPENSPVLAADDGIVVLVGSGQYGYGNYVVIAHAGGLTTLYGHLNKTGVKPGDTVTQGQIIGLEGSTGNSTGPHLHFELRVSGQPIDPTPYLPPGLPSASRD